MIRSLQLRSLLLQFDRLLPDELLQGSSSNLRKARFLLSLSFIGSLFTLPRAIDVWSTSTAFPSAEDLNYLVSLLVMATIPILLWKFRSVRPAAFAICIMLLVCVPLGTYIQHGLYGQTAPSLLICGFLFPILVSNRASITFVALLVLSIIGLAWLHHIGHLRQPDSVLASDLASRTVTYVFFVGVVWTMSHLSDRSFRKALHQAEEATRARERFIATISHEIRTPLNAIVGQVDLLELDEKDSEKRKDLKLIQTSCDYLLHLLNQILQYSKKAHDQEVPLMSTSFRLDHIIANCAELGLMLSRYHNLRFEVHRDASVARTCEGDSVRIQQILVNLLSNAFRYTQAGGQVIFRARYTKGHALFSIIDNGVGIPKEKQRKIFEPFVQAGAESNNSVTGFGLGLSIVKNILAQFGGKIMLRSSVGRGSCFHVKLPLRDLGQVEIASSPTQSPVIDAAERRDASGQGNQKTRVLYVDDNRVNLAVMEKLLSRVDCETIKMNRAQGAFEFLEEHGPGSVQMIFMDCQMPDINGFEAARILLKRFPWISEQRIPIIAVTASVQPEEVDICYASGMNGFLAKPVSLNQLKQIKDRLLKSRAA